MRSGTDWEVIISGFDFHTRPVWLKMLLTPIAAFVVVAVSVVGLAASLFINSVLWVVGVYWLLDQIVDKNWRSHEENDR